MLRKEETRQARHLRIRKRVLGNNKCPRLNVFRSINNIYAQLVDDEEGRTMLQASTIDKEMRGSIKTGGNMDAAKAVGALIAKRAKKKGIKKVVFDRGGYKYHGRIKAVADAAREAGLEF